MSKFKVTQPACYVTVPGVGAVLLYRDAPVPDSAVDLDQLVEAGFIVEVGDDEVGGHPSDLTYDPTIEPGDSAAPAEPDDVDGDGPIPAKSALKEEWVAYAVSKGATQEEAENSTKEDLIAAYGSA